MKLISFKRVGREKEEPALKGYLTVYLTLSLTVILSLFLVLIEGARMSGARLVTECVADIGMNSILAEYHRELLEQYEVFFIDTSYGTALPSYYKTAEHLEDYMEHNFSLKDSALGLAYHDVFDLSVQNVQIGNLSVATDNNGQVFRKQAIEYMYDKYGISLLSDVSNWVSVVENYKLDDSDVEARRTEIENQIHSIDGKEIQISEEEWITVEVENPADSINARRNQGILFLVMENTDELSNVSFDTGSSISRRTLNTGIGLNPLKENGENLADKLLFDEYLLEKFSRYGQELPKSHLKYQIEYILAGKSCDLDNLKAIASRLLFIREAANVMFLFGNTARRAQAALVAAAVSAIFLVPELQPLLEYSILFAWAFAESVCDVKALFAGGKIPLLKDGATWYTDIGCLGKEFTAGDGSTGLTYEDYLRVLLALGDTNQKTRRCMDMAELDIRKTAGNSQFRLDGCVDSMMLEINVISDYGNSFFIKRRCCYG